MRKNDRRIPWVDNAKAIGIYLVVLGHQFIPSYLEKFIFSFHMPLFFFLSGITFRSKNNENLYDFLIRKFQTIIVPYFFFSIITYLYWLFIGRKVGDVSNTNPFRPLIGIFYSNGINNWLEHNRPLWFLTCLYVTESIFNLIARLQRKNMLFILLLSAIIGYLLSLTDFIRLPWGINVSLTSIVFLGLGYWGKDLFEAEFKFFHLLFISFISVILVCIISVINIKVDMNSNIYGNIFLFYAGAFLGIIVIVSLAQLIPQNNILSFIGRNTLVILGFHGFIGSMIKGIMVYILKMDLEILGFTVFPNIVHSMLIIFFSIPLSIILNRYFPVLIGRKRSMNKMART